VYGVYLFVSGYGNMKVWLNNCKVMIDNQPLSNFVNVKYKAQEDHEFDKASRIQLPPMTPIMIENLEILGKVWGFLKYYHPEVAKGNYNWDYELFRILPRIAEAKDKNERNKLLNHWIDSYGKITETKGDTITDSTQFSRIIDLSWLTDKNTFDEALISKLHLIRNAKRKKSHYYIQHYYNSPANLNESREPKYPDISWEDQGFRILTLFKFWNVMEYCSSFVELTDQPWNTLLKKYIPRFLEPENKEKYEFTMRELFACINDSHDFASSPTFSLYLLPPDSFCYVFPIQLTATENGEIVVKHSSVKEFKQGDIIQKIDGKNMNEIIERYVRYVPASKRSTLVHIFILDWGLPLLLPKNSKLTVTSMRDGKEMTRTFDCNWLENKTVYNKKTNNDYENKYQFAAKKIAYIDIGTMRDDSITDFIARNRLSKGIIIDIRSRYANNMYVDQALRSWLVKGQEVFCWLSVNDKSNPGNFEIAAKMDAGTNNPDYYRGKVAILVDEGTMSFSELRSMAYRKAINSKIIGTSSAGAVGPVDHFYLPEGLFFQYAGAASYYPDWEVAQRKGVKIDIPVKQTVEDIRNGRDVWMEKAIQFIESK
jgi:C-terminal processing protease CtpA/Prc